MNKRKTKTKGEKEGRGQININEILSFLVVLVENLITKQEKKKLTNKRAKIKNRIAKVMVYNQSDLRNDFQSQHCNHESITLRINIIILIQQQQQKQKIYTKNKIKFLTNNVID